MEVEKQKKTINGLIQEKVNQVTSIIDLEEKIVMLNSSCGEHDKIYTYVEQ